MGLGQEDDADMLLVLYFGTRGGCTAWTPYGGLSGRTGEDSFDSSFPMLNGIHFFSQRRLVQQCSVCRFSALFSTRVCMCLPTDYRTCARGVVGSRGPTPEKGNGKLPPEDWEVVCELAEVGMAFGI